MGFTPISNNILVKLPEPETEKKTDKGLYLPDSLKDSFPMKGKVVAVGAGKLNLKGRVVPVAFQPGDTVLFEQYTGTELLLDNKRHLIIPESKLLGMFAPDPSN